MESQQARMDQPAVRGTKLRVVIMFMLASHGITSQIIMTTKTLLPPIVFTLAIKVWGPNMLRFC